jgi:pyruvoyl-dependent arginine decarboxylase (PvlArgDC)
LGRPDIVILPKDKSKNAYIMEFKNEYTSSNKTAEEAAKEAMKQIKDKKYEEGIKNTGVKDNVHNENCFQKIFYCFF